MTPKELHDLSLKRLLERARVNNDEQLAPALINSLTFISHLTGVDITVLAISCEIDLLRLIIKLEDRIRELENEEQVVKE